MRFGAGVALSIAVCLAMVGLAGAASSERGGRLPKLTQPDAEHYARQSIKSKFEYFNYAGGKVVRCSKRISRIRVRCKVKWWIGDVSTRGKVTVWYRWHRGDVWWYTRGRVKVLNEYCLSEGGSRSHCTDIKTWGY